MSNKPTFKLPPEVSSTKERLPFGHAYLFRHQMLGDLGRIVLTDEPGGLCRITSEVAGNPADPMTQERLKIFEPLSAALIEAFDHVRGEPSSPLEPIKAPAFPPGSEELVASKVLQCEFCGEKLALLVFAPHALDVAGLEDQARRMFSHISQANLPTWVIGAPIHSGSALQATLPAWTRKVWPQREPAQYLTPEEFNPIIDALQEQHCSLVNCHIGHPRPCTKNIETHSQKKRGRR